MLNVYRASAGSGKTFRLTLEYIKLLLTPAREGGNVPLGERQKLYRRILAVTFTNKATDEMKGRIVKELFNLSQNPEESPYTQHLKGKDGITDNIDELKRQASEQLYMLLHDFSGFNISTIDRFFQQITRAFMYEAGLSNKYNIELDSSMILSEAVDQMFFELEKSENKELLEWLINYAQQQIEEEAYKLFRKKISELAQEIFKEQYKSNRHEIQEKLQDKNALKNYIKELDRIKRNFETEIKKCASEALTLMSENGVAPEDFKHGNKSGACQFRHWANGDYKLPGTRFIQLANGEITDWYTKGKISADIIAGIQHIEIPLRDRMQRIVELLDKPYTEYLSAKHTRKHLYTLGILNDIVEYIQEYKNEHGALLLSDTNDLLRNIINDDDTPFVYEKIGTYIDHFFIDEFQDTSVTQWNNFYPLIKDSNDRGQSNLLVGDVKQSIYRFRNSDWELLNSRLPHYFNDSELTDCPLDTNWRSAANVIRFNNSFFDRVAAYLPQNMIDLMPETLQNEFSEKIGRVYQNSAQKLGDKTLPDSGYVEVSFIENNKEDGMEGRVRQQSLNKLTATLRDLQDRGVALREIAILVRRTEEGNRIVRHLLHEQAADTEGRYRYDVISDEALYISNAPTVRLIIALLDYLNDPQTAINRFMALYSIAILYHHIPEEEAIQQVCATLQKEEKPEELARIESLRGEALYEVCEKIIDLYPIDSTGNENVFIQAFLDLILQYTGKRASDLNSFLIWWHDKGCTHSLATPKEQDAIQIMTIHKSKGLEFDVVLIPFCNWSFDYSNNHLPTLWAKTAAPFSALPVVPITYDKELANTIYSQDYLTEMLYAYIDNVNLAYVAFTRAREELYIFTEKTKVAKKTAEKIQIKSIGSLLQQCIVNGSADLPDAQPPFVDLSAGYDDENSLYTLGEKKMFTPKEKKETVITIQTPYRSTNPTGRLHLRLMGQRYFDHSDGRYRGTVCHDILSTIKTVDDIGRALQKHIRSGEITRNEASEMETMLRRQLAVPEIGKWFAPGSRILNECEILVPHEGTYRPDRIVIDENGATIIDYKFGAERKSHHRQVARYMRFLQEMGYATRGYLWYITTPKVIEVNLSDEK